MSLEDFGSQALYFRRLVGIVLGVSMVLLLRIEVTFATDLKLNPDPEAGQHLKKWPKMFTKRHAA